MRPDDKEMEEDYIDWFFLSHFGKGPGFWRGLPEDKIVSYMALENLKEKRYWDNWVDIYKKVYG